MTEKTTAVVVQEKGKTQKWKYAAAWLKAEPFWQGVAASTLSTGGMALAGLFAALMTGWIDLRAAFVAVLSFAIVLTAAALILAPKPSWAELVARHKEIDKEASFVTLPGLVGIFVVSLGLLIAIKVFGW